MSKVSYSQFKTTLCHCPRDTVFVSYKGRMFLLSFDGSSPLLKVDGEYYVVSWSGLYSCDRLEDTLFKGYILYFEGDNSPVLDVPLSQITVI